MVALVAKSLKMDAGAQSTQRNEKVNDMTPNKFEFLNTYSEWITSVWLIDEKHKSLFVCITGFAGEAGEVSEAMLLQDPKELLKEMGDFLYYWIRLHQIYERPVHWQKFEELALFEKEHKTQVILKAHEDPALDLARAVAAQTLGLKLFKGIGRVCEMIKKSIRDDYFNEDDFYAQMDSVLVDFASVCEHWGFSIEQIARTNQEKIIDRQKRGTLLGSGNNR